jgi:hypothetical protein
VDILSDFTVGEIAVLIHAIASQVLDVRSDVNAVVSGRGLRRELDFQNRRGKTKAPPSRSPATQLTIAKVGSLRDGVFVKRPKSRVIAGIDGNAAVVTPTTPADH